MSTTKCVHEGCKKPFIDATEPCIYHPGAAVFHEGKKGWQCCKPRVLTFEEFMSIPPCTTGIHSAVDDTPKPEPVKKLTDEEMEKYKPKPKSALATPAAVTPRATTPAPPPESEDDEPSVEIPAGKSCRRQTCNATYLPGSNRDEEKCVHHPGVPLFHEGARGYTCCKRKVFEFSDFLGLEGCTIKPRHMFVGSGKKKSSDDSLSDVRMDYYQTPSTVIAAIYLKKIDKATSTITFVDTTTISLDLKTSDGKTYKTDFAPYGAIDTEKSKFAIKGTKLELELAKADDMNWQALRADDQPTGGIYQLGKARSELDRS